MPGTKTGGFKTAETVKKQYGDDFYRRIGRKGGQKSRNGGFASDVVGKDGLTGRERAKIVGAKGGRISKRTKRPKINDPLAMQAYRGNRDVETPFWNARGGKNA